jgi:4-amino-4-deoxy-L-arabinose transferase-like glycosyltransferase
MLGSLPVFLAHAGLATTDAAFAATFAAAFFSFLFWLERPSVLRGFLFGAAIALALCTKLSALLFIPASFAAVLAHRWLCEGGSWRPVALLRSWHRCLAPLATFLLTVWIVFGCNADPLYGIVGLVDGVRELTAFADGGAPSYFLGEINPHGSWAFFPVLLVVKSPIPFLVAVAIGAAVLLRLHWRDWRSMAPLIGAAAIIASVIPSSINMGLRHLLPVFPLLALVAGAGLARLLTRPWALPRLAALGLILAWQIGESAAASPDYLAYFNQLGRDQPERIVAGSDLDWGQDIGRLVTEIRRRQISSIRLALHTSAELSDYGFPAFEPLYPGEPANRWVAISEQMRAFYCAGYRWLDAHRPVARIGASIRLYYIPDDLPDLAPESPDPLRSVNWSLPLPCPPSRR